MNRDYVHSLLALLFSFIAPFAGHRYLAEAPSGSDLMVWAARVGTIMALSQVVFLVLLWSWLTKDAVAHGRSRGQAAAYLVVSVPTVGLGMLHYLYTTRLEGMAAAMKFAGLLAACLVALNLGPRLPYD